MNTRRCTLLAILVAGCGISYTFAQPGGMISGQPLERRSPEPSNVLPTAAQQEKAQGRITRLLNGHIDLETDDPATTSRYLRDLALGTDDDPAAQFILFRMALDFAEKAIEYPLAQEIIDHAAQRYQIDTIQWETDAFKAILESSADQTAQSDIKLKQALRIAEHALMTDRVELADELIAMASKIANRSESQTLIDEVARWNELANEWSIYARKARYAALRLRQKPLDTRATLALGRYLCFIKGDWNNGLALLAQCSDKSIREVAQVEVTFHDDQNRIAVADSWFKLAQEYKGLVKQRMTLHADEIYRSVYPTVTGLTRLRIEEQMISRPLFVFDSSDPPSEHWVEEKLNIWGGHGREGSGSWAHLTIEEGQAILVSNRAGYIQTLEDFPPKGVEHYRIDAILWSDLLNGTALEFGRQRMFFGSGQGIHIDGGWAPDIIFPITSNKFYHYLIDVSPEGISFTVDGVYLGTMKTDSLAIGPIVLRGWEGHARSRRLVVWALPDPTLPFQLNQHPPGLTEPPQVSPED